MKSGAIQLLLFCIIMIQVVSRRSRERSVRLRVESGPAAYEGEVAGFGDQFSDDKPSYANLMLPPDDKLLCEFPPSLLNMTRNEAQEIMTSQRGPIALLVSRGKCDFIEKALVALEMRERFTDQLKYVIIYNDRTDTPKSLIKMSTTREVDNKLDAMGFAFISTDTGKALTEKYPIATNDTNQNYKFLEKSNQTWQLPLIMRPYSATGSRNDGERWSYGQAARETFHWLRYILFSLLIFSPVIRAGYLWYASGGRVLMRRNENGRINGIQYIRPIPYWFASSVEEQSEVRPNILTEEEVDALPEITFRIKEKIDDDNNLVSENSLAQTAVSTNSVSTTDTTNQVEESNSVDVEQPLEKLPTPLNLPQPTPTDKEENSNDVQSVTTTQLFTTCSMCSICIEDFEDGERIKVLPECKHGFHTDCIKPWLTERQGCCALCKTMVKPRED